MAGETTGGGDPPRVVWHIPREDPKAIQDGRHRIAEHARLLFGDGNADTSHRSGLCAVDRAELCAAELLTNASVHGRGSRITVTEIVGEKAYKVEIHDRGGTGRLVAPGQDQLTCERADNGRGLLIVQECADHWEVQPRGRGTTVWFEIDLPELRDPALGPMGADPAGGAA